MMDSPSFKKLLAVTSIFGAIGISGGAMAGQRWVESVVANSTRITGNLADARNSTSDQEVLQIFDYGSTMYIHAAQHDGTWATCITDDSTAVAQLRAANSDASLIVDISEGRCIWVMVINSSYHAPKDH